MSALSNIPRHAVLPLGAYDKNGLVCAALQTDQTLLQCDCAAAHDKASVLAALGEGLKLPAHYGCNLDALYDCLTDLKPNKRVATFALFEEVRESGVCDKVEVIR